MATFINLFLHRGPIARRIRECVSDLTALDILQPSIWIDIDEDFNGLYLAPGREPQADDLSVLSRHIGRTPVHLVLLNVIGGEGSEGLIRLEDVTRYRERLTQDQVPALNAASTNLVVTTVFGKLEGEFPLVPGFQNLLLSPEESVSPASASDPFTANEENDEDFGLSVATSVASLFGLWEGSGSLPVEVPSNTNDGLKLVRTFYRRVDGQEVQEKIRARVLDTQKIPAVRRDSNGQPLHVVHNRNQNEINQVAVATLLEKHKQSIDAPYHEAKKEATKHVKASQAIKKFAAFYFQQLISWPKVFVDNLSSDLKTSFNKRVDDLLHGEGSKFRVDGLDAPRDSSGYGSQQRDQFPPIHHNSNPSLYAGLWKDYRDSALAMIDGSPRELENPQHNVQAPDYLRGSKNAVKLATKASDVIPGPSATLTPEFFGAGLRGQIGNVQLEPYDIKGIQQLEARINNLNVPGGQHSQSRFHQWKNKWSGSLAGEMGAALYRKEIELERERDRAWKHYLQMERQSQDVPEEKGPLIWRWLGYVTFWSMALFAILWGLGNLLIESDKVTPLLLRWVSYFNESELKTKFWLFGIWTLLWLICFLIQVFLESLAIHRAAGVRQSLVTAKEAAYAQAYAMDKALAQIRASYTQFISISRIYGSVIERPFGTVRKKTRLTEVPTNTMPASVVIAKAEPDESIVKDFADDVREEVYTQGWLAEPIKTVYDTAMRDITARHGSLGADEGTLLTTWGHGSGELLDQMANAVTRREFVEQDRSAAKWDVVVRLLNDDGGKQREKMLKDPVIYSNDQRYSADTAGSLSQDQNSGSFNGRFIERAGAAGVNAGVVVDSTYRQLNHDDDNVGMSELLVQYGSSIDHQVLVLNRTNQGSRTGSFEVYRPADDVGYGQPQGFEPGGSGLPGMPGQQPPTMPGYYQQPQQGNQWPDPTTDGGSIRMPGMD
ncbi:ABC transporter ATP-binding protein [Corynebacterium aquatimens]|uniref:Uncharacterized protein n=1 Tax=Corynebacterium aquatimens TaxID=1190508 RepID=A0A931GSC0_9CORY|nr:ABC transporter ATP-binding protein [Corynebacterium aquatimens]MBG6122893.1 hypothetical protein [Corynebacterium aquatimens]WJY66772.1 hypothetical protein CAQUA_10425 [Corynebacterium aquatimens]